MSTAAATAPEAASAPPEKGSRVLRNGKHERYAQARALGHGIVEAGRRAGWAPGSGGGSKAEKRRDVQDRIDYLGGVPEAFVRSARADINRMLSLVASANMDDFVTLAPTIPAVEGEPVRVLPVLDLTRIAALPEDQRRELMASIKTVKYTEHGVHFELHGKLEAAAQLRKLNGLDAPERVELGGADGGPVIHEVRWREEGEE